MTVIELKKALPSCQIEDGWIQTIVQSGLEQYAWIDNMERGHFIIGKFCPPEVERAVRAFAQTPVAKRGFPSSEW